MQLMAGVLESPIQFSKRSQLLAGGAQRNAFHRRDARQQSRLFAPQNRPLRPIPNSIRHC
jgi:hypothetical protein